MMKNKITILFTLSVIIMMGITSCSKKLDEVLPQDAISKDQALKDPNAARTLYHGVYARFKAYNSTLFQLGEMRSDIWVDGLFTESADGGLKNLYTHNISATNVPFSNWAGFYNLIYNMNNVLKIIPLSPLPADERDRILAEVYGLRAYIYYLMVQTWGNVPLNTEPVETINNAAETYKHRTGADTVMAQVKSDIEKSLQLFGPSNTIAGGKRVYWNRIATLVLKGDVFNWTGTHMGGGAADFTTAKNALMEVKNLQGATLDLQANYADIFDPNKKNNNKEIIFAVNYEIQQGENGIFGSFRVNPIQAASLSLAQAPTPTVASVYPYVNGANRVGINPTLFPVLTGAPADQRISNSIKVMYNTSSPYAVRGVMLTKFIGTTAGTTQVYNNDYPIYRFADVLLLLAEAKSKLGEDPSAEINAIRLRAYGGAAPVFTNGSITQNQEAVLDEYLREFIGEGKRWLALRRAGDNFVYAKMNPVYLSPATQAKFLLPISQSMIANDPLLVQTPGY